MPSPVPACIDQPRVGLGEHTTNQFTMGAAPHERERMAREIGSLLGSKWLAYKRVHRGNRSQHFSWREILVAIDGERLYVGAALDHHSNEKPEETAQASRGITQIDGDLRLNLGCGRFPISGWVNVDSVKLPEVDVVADLEAGSLPFANDSVSEIAGSHLLERIRNSLGLMQELHRIAKPDARATFRVPYGSSDDADTDPTHVRRYFWARGDISASPMIGVPIMATARIGKSKISCSSLKTNTAARHGQTFFRLSKNVETWSTKWSRSSAQSNLCDRPCGDCKSNRSWICDEYVAVARNGTANAFPRSSACSARRLTPAFHAAIMEYRRFYAIRLPT